jgi:hypothetical protein
MSIAAVDPYGNRVIIPPDIIPYAEISSRSGITDSPDKVIQRPALMLTSCKEPMTSPTEPCENHYLRLVNMDNTLLISARKEEEGRWKAYRCICNPSIKQMAALFQNTRQLAVDTEGRV